MKTQLRGTIVFLCAIAALTWAIAKTHPDCEDSAVKNYSITLSLYGQWFIFGLALALFEKGNKYIQTFLAVLIGTPLMACVWVWSLWPIEEFGYSWDLIIKMQSGYLYFMPLGLAGTFLGQKIKQKRADKALQKLPVDV